MSEQFSVTLAGTVYTFPDDFTEYEVFQALPAVLRDLMVEAVAVVAAREAAEGAAGTAGGAAGAAVGGAEDAATAARLAQAWAESLGEPGGAGTKSALAWAALAAAAAEAAQTSAGSIDGATVPDPAPENAGHLYGSDGTSVVLLEGVPVPTPAVGNTGLFPRSTGSGVEWASLTVVGGTLVTGAVQLVAGLAYTITAPAAVTLTLPLAPAAGAAVRLMDGESISTSVVHTVARNGQTIMGLAEDMVLDTPGIDVTIWFNGSDWRLF